MPGFSYEVIYMIMTNVSYKAFQSYLDQLIKQTEDGKKDALEGNSIQRYDYDCGKLDAYKELKSILYVFQNTKKGFWEE